MKKALHIILAAMLLAPLPSFADGETSLFVVANFTNSRRAPRVQQLPQANNTNGARGPVIYLKEKKLLIDGATINLENISGFSFEMREVTGIKDVKAPESTAKSFSVYSIDGRLVRANATSLDGLPKGVYIANGKKVLVK